MNNAKTTKTGFPPVSRNSAEILILGSMPGEQSLIKHQYYGHRRNVFWVIMGKLFNFDPEIEYEKRLSELKENKIALWDVLKTCERKGSLDSSIISASEVANNFVDFLSIHKKIEKICFNGQKAHQTFLKHVLKKFPQITQDIDIHILPSTSPANASISFEKKLIEWKKIFIQTDSTNDYID